MTVLTQPASFSLSGNIEKFRISTTEEFSFILKKGTEEILSSVYSPGKDHLVTIDIREIVESKLSFLLKDQSEPYVQTSIFADFTAVIDKKEISFRVLRGGVDRLAISAENFVTSNFLTWQPQIKPVTYYTPEFLTYYATVDGNVCVKAYFSQEEGEVTSEIKTVYSVLAGNAYSIPVQYAVIMALFGSRYPSFYDVWVENSSGDRLTYIQRYGSVENLTTIGCNADVNRKVRQLASMAGIKKKITFHTSRHTCATMLIYKRVPITTVQKILGHTSVRTTQIYSEIIPETMIRDLEDANMQSC